MLRCHNPGSCRSPIAWAARRSGDSSRYTVPWWQGERGAGASRCCCTGSSLASVVLALHFAVDPAEEFRHTCVYPRLVLLATSRPPARHTSHVPAAVVLAHQGPPAVPLARILPPLQVPSAHHARGQVALVHLVTVADLVVNEFDLGLPQLWGGVIFCRASFSLVFPKPVMKQDLPVWNRWPCMGRQAGRI